MPTNDSGLAGHASEAVHSQPMTPSTPPDATAGPFRVVRNAAACCLALLLLPWSAAQPGWQEVAAIFQERCTLCHAGKGAPLGVRLTDHEAVLAGGDDGPVVVPGDPDASELVRRIRGESLPRMPLTGPPYLSDERIATIEGWIAAGAPGPADAPADAPGGAPADPPDASRADDSPASPDASPNASPEEAAPAPADAPEPGSFAAVEAVLQRRCVECHTPGGAMGAAPEGLVLSSYASLIAGGERVVVVPGAPLASELYRRVEGWARPRMPLDGPPFLSEATIASLRQWIEAGAPGPDGEVAAVPVGGEVRLHGTLTGRWSLDGLEIATTDDTRIDDDPSVGSYVEVRGVVREDGSIVAERIRSR